MTIDTTPAAHIHRNDEPATAKGGRNNRRKADHKAGRRTEHTKAGDQAHAAGRDATTSTPNTTTPAATTTTGPGKTTSADACTTTHHNGRGWQHMDGESRTSEDGAPTASNRAPQTTQPDNTNSTFEQLGVPAALADALLGCGITSPFPIQQATLPDALRGRDLLGQGRTGSGKTLAFLIPTLARLSETPSARPKRPHALILVPTRELATQVAAVAAPLAQAVGRRVTTVFGGVPHNPQLRQLNQGVDIVVACPGRLLDHLQAGAINLDQVHVCILDEADHMADQGFLPMVKRILDQVPAQAQQMLFSATLAGGVDTIVTRYLNNPVTHTTQSEPPAELHHEVIVVDDDARVETVVTLIGDQRAVVFTRTKHRARQLARKLTAHGLTAVDMHGNLSQNARERNLAAFAAGTAQVMVATDIAARGIHIDEIPLVIHADPPIEHKAYTHRSGRTARAGATGTVITVATAEQKGDVRALLAKAGVKATWRTTTG